MLKWKVLLKQISQIIELLLKQINLNFLEGEGSTLYLTSLSFEL